MLKNLRKILPVPDSPIDVDPATWRQNVQSLGTDFPKDFVAYGRIYGTGHVRFGHYSMDIYSPFTPGYPWLVQNYFARPFGELRDFSEAHDVPLGLFPEPGGLLPFAHADRVWFTWKTGGRPSQWKVVCMHDYAHDAYEIFEMGFCAFWVAFLTLRIRLQVIDYDTWDPRTGISFSPGLLYSF